MGLLRLPWTIWRQTTLELWRLMLLTAGVLVTVISFAASVLLAAQGKLDPLDTLKYMGLVMPPMLQFALPFAAGFAATLSYHRMSQDNELTAAAAGGVSHRLLLVPALASGVVLAGGMMVLLDEVAPRFYREMERIVAKDAARLVATSIESGRPLEMAGTLVHADRVRQLGPNPETGAFDSLMLTGVFMLDRDKLGRVEREAAASQAVAEFVREKEEGDRREEAAGGGRVHVGLRLTSPMVFTAQDGLSPNAGSMTVYATLPSSYDDNPKFRTTRQLLELPEHPDRLRFIDARRRELALRIGERETTGAIQKVLKEKGAVTLKDGSGREFAIKASGIGWNGTRWELAPPARGGLEVELSGSGVTLYMTAERGGLRSDMGDDLSGRRLSFTLELERVAARLKAGDPAGTRDERVYRNLQPAQNPMPGLLQLTSRELLAESDRRAEGRPGDEFVSRPAEDLRAMLAKVGREITSKYHERWAASLAAAVMVVAGALTAMRLGGSMPLTVYLWSFFPALFSVITISAGQQMAHKVGLGGLVVLWAGVGVLVVYVVVAFGSVRRH